MIKSVFLVLFIQFLLHSFCIFGQNSTCIDVMQCQTALKLINTTERPGLIIIQSLKRHFCGYQGSQPQIDCSKLTESILKLGNIKLLPESCGLIEGNRIFGGQEVGLYEFPWMVLISYKTQKGLEFKCGGTLINSRYVLTAAHCIVGMNIAGVRIGEHDIATETDCQGTPPKIECESRIQDIRIEEQITHNEYSKFPEIINDIGLLRLENEVDFLPRNARPICLPITAALQEKNLTGLSAVVAGWGFTESGSVSNILLKVGVTVSNKQDCKALYSKRKNVINLVNNLCAGEFGKDSCSGDSGGPLMLEGMHNGVTRFIQHGIISYGPRICASNLPGVYTDVSKYIEWILVNIRK